MSVSNALSQLPLISIAPLRDILGITRHDAKLRTIDYIKREGYPVEEYTNIETSDGYQLVMHRIPHGKNNSNVENKPVVFLMHGLLCSSADWVNMGSDRSIAYQLSDAGYDVWMGNARGNNYSRKHTTYDPDTDSNFWTFSWHEIGTIDLPTMIDHVLKTTKQEKLFYIGHSQGTTSFFVMTSEKPEYNEKIRLMVAFAPVAYMSHADNLFLKFVGTFPTSTQMIEAFLGAAEFMPSDGLLSTIGQATCILETVARELCSSVLFLMMGWDSEQLDRDKIPAILENSPAGASTMQFLHYAQGASSGEFAQYDHGLGNLEKYNQTSPPNYNTKAITAPILLAYSENDNFAAVVDVEQLAGELPNAKKYLVPLKKFNHMDFTYATDCRSLLYDHVLEALQKHKME